MVNVENSLVRTCTLFPKYVTFTPRYGQLVLGNTLKESYILSSEKKMRDDAEIRKSKNL